MNFPRRPVNVHGAYHVFVHGLSGDELKDHTDHAYWLGNEWPLDLRQFQRGARS